MAREALARVGDTLDAICPTRAGWSAIELVAQALVDAGELSYEEIRRLA